MEGNGDYQKLVKAELQVAQHPSSPSIPHTMEYASQIQAHLVLELMGAGFPPQRAGGLCSLAVPDAPKGCLVHGCTDATCAGNRVTVNQGNGR